MTFRNKIYSTLFAIVELVVVLVLLVLTARSEQPSDNAERENRYSARAASVIPFNLECGRTLGLISMGVLTAVTPRDPAKSYSRFEPKI